MSNVLCPQCGHHIFTIQNDPERAPEAATSATHADQELWRTVEQWLLDSDWSGRVQTSELFDRYRDETGDHRTSHRSWSIAMQKAGVWRGRAARGVRVFER